MNAVHYFTAFTYHEVALHKFQVIGHFVLLGIHGSSVNLVLVDVDAGDMTASKARDLSSRAANTAAHVKNLHVTLDSNLRRNEVFVPSNSLLEWLAICESTKVKGSAPSVFIKVGREVVVPLLRISFNYVNRLEENKLLSCDAGIIVCSRLSNCRGLVFSRLVVPVLKVFIDCCSSCSLVFAHHGT